MDAFLHGTRLSIKWHGSVYWFDGENSEIGVNGSIVRNSTLVRLPDYEARYFMDKLDELASQFPRKDEANPEYTMRRRELITFAETELRPYMEQPII